MNPRHQTRSVTLLVAAAAFAHWGLAEPALAQPSPTPALPPSAVAALKANDKLAKIGHIVVIFEENRSFDSFFGKFPGANGIANAGRAAIQLDENGQPYKFLPAPRNTNLTPPAEDKRFPPRLANRPFEYRFSMDFEVKVPSAAEAALNGLESEAAEVRLFGSYPAWVEK